MYDAIKTIIDTVDIPSRCIRTTTSAWPPPTPSLVVQAGATFLSTTCDGHRGKDRQLSLEEVVMASKHLLGMDTGIETSG
jgi:homocitrate synthase NifV